MKVIAAPGLKVPKEENPREYITDDANAGRGVDIDITSYYLRRLADGELVEVVAPTTTPTTTPTGAAAAAQDAKAAKAAKA